MRSISEHQEESKFMHHRIKRNCLWKTWTFTTDRDSNSFQRSCLTKKIPKIYKNACEHDRRRNPCTFGMISLISSNQYFLPNYSDNSTKNHDIFHDVINFSIVFSNHSSWSEHYHRLCCLHFHHFT